MVVLQVRQLALRLAPRPIEYVNYEKFSDIYLDYTSLYCLVHLLRIVGIDVNLWPGIWIDAETLHSSECLIITSIL